MICIQMKDYLLIRLVVLIYLNEPHLGKHIKKEKRRLESDDMFIMLEHLRNKVWFVFVDDGLKGAQLL